jgi:hypothetical protein
MKTLRSLKLEIVGDVLAGYAILIILLFANFVMVGCAARVKHVTNLPAGVTEKQARDYDAAVGNLHKIAASTSAFRQSVINLRNQGMITDDGYYVSLLQGISRVDQLQLAATGVLRDSPEYFAQGKTQVLQYTQEISKEIAKLNGAGVTGIKSATAQTEITRLLGEITAATALVIALTS